MKKITSLLVTVGLFSSVLVGCASSGSGGASSSEQVIRVGLQAPMTGENGQYGIKMKDGVDLAFRVINSKGGVNGKKLELVVGDDKASPAEAVAVVNKMVTRDGVRAVIGGFNSSPTLASQEVTGPAKVPHLHMGANPDLSKTGNPYLFRMILTDRIYVPGMMKYMIEKQQVKKIAALYENTDYGTALSEAGQKEGEAMGATFVSVDPYNPGDKDFSAQITKIKSLNPDAIMISGLYNEAALISQQARQAGLNVKLFSPADGVDSMQLVTIGGKDVEGYIFATMVDLNTDSKEINEFKKLASENNISPETYTSIAYDAAMIVAKAFEQGQDDPEKVREAIAGIQYQGISGTVSFDENGDRTNTNLEVPVMTVKDGKFVRVQD